MGYETCAPFLFPLEGRNEMLSCYNCGKLMEGFSQVKFVGGKGVRLFCRECKNVKVVKKAIPLFTHCHTENEDNIVRLARVLN